MKHAAATVDSKAQAPQHNLRQFLSYRIGRLSVALSAQATAILEETSGLGLGQWRVLSMIGSGMASSARDLSAKIGVDPGFVSRTLRSLELAGYVETHRPDNDRRLLQVVMTKKGEAVYRKTLPYMQARQEALLSALDAKEREMIFRIIDKLELAAEKRTFEP